MLCIEFGDDGGEISAMTNFPVVDSWQPPGSPAIPELAGPVAGSPSSSDWAVFC